MSSNLAFSLVIGAAVGSALRGLTQIQTKTNSLNQSIEHQQAKYQALSLQI